jgi:hypothetical protein
MMNENDIPEEFLREVEAEINRQNPNEPEELNPRAVVKLAYYLYYNEMSAVEDGVQAYFLYDLLKFTAFV